jgi:hypothetical protein
MRDPSRTVLVISPRPHAWALLRDRLDPALVSVHWRAPAALESLSASPPWALAGDLPTLSPASLRHWRGRPLAVHWVGPPPAGLPARPRLHGDWRELAAALARGLQARLAGLRLAPSHGLLLPGGRFLRETECLEVLLAVHPEALELAGPGSGLRATARRVRRLLERAGVPVELEVAGATLRLREKEDVGAS